MEYKRGPGKHRMMETKFFAVAIAGLMLVGGAAADSYGDSLDVGIEYDYSAMVIPVGGVKYFDLSVSSNVSETVNLRTELSQIDSQFAENEQNSIEYNIPPNGNKTFRVQISPQVSTQGPEQLKVTTRNLNTSLEKSFEFPIYIRQAPKTQSVELPGATPITVMMVFLAASALILKRRPFYS